MRAPSVAGSSGDSFEQCRDHRLAFHETQPSVAVGTRPPAAGGTTHRTGRADRASSVRAPARTTGRRIVAGMPVAMTSSSPIRARRDIRMHDRSRLRHADIHNVRCSRLDRGHGGRADGSKIHAYEFCCPCRPRVRRAHQVDDDRVTRDRGCEGRRVQRVADNGMGPRWKAGLRPGPYQRVDRKHAGEQPLDQRAAYVTSAAGDEDGFEGHRIVAGRVASVTSTGQSTCVVRPGRRT